VAAPDPPQAAADPAQEAPPAADLSAPARAPKGLRIESVLASSSYERFTCPRPSKRFSLRSDRTVNVCLEVVHRPGNTDRLSLIWERNGGFSGKTPVTITGRKQTVRTRARMKLGESRLGSWSVRVVSDRNVSLAETTFDVER
jgi:hypothetical protein